MTLELQRTKRSRTDALRYAKYIARKSSLQKGEDFLAALEEDYTYLTLNPALRPEKIIGKLRCRTWPVSGFEKYLILYRYDETRLEIVRVLHGARDLPRLFSAPQE